MIVTPVPCRGRAGRVGRSAALAWGWQPADEPLSTAPFSRWARDDAGRWHIGRQVWNDIRRDGVVLDIALVPPLHPAATSVQVILTGPTGRAAAMVPLPWHAAG